MPIVAQRDWRFCDKCSCFWFNGRSTKGVCPAGGQHSSSQSGDYIVVSDPDGAFSSTVVAQRDWRYCDKCLGIFFNGQASKGVCPAGGSHSSAQSGDYAILTDADRNFQD